MEDSSHVPTEDVPEEAPAMFSSASPSLSAVREAATVVPVVIVGGGLSGLSAAARLTSLNVRFLLLEAQPHLGGRVRSVPATASRPALDLGATWFHGTSRNAAYDLAVSSGLLPPPNSDADAEHNEEEEFGVLVCSAPAVYVVDGEPRSLPAAEALPVARAFAAALDSLSDPDSAAVAKPSDAISVAEHVRECLNFDRMSVLQRAVFHARECLQCTFDGCDDGLHQLSAARYDEYEILPGGNETAPKDGMATLVGILRAKLHDNCVMLGKEVTTIHWLEQHGGVRVVTSDGAVVKANCLIWTPSVNVTKAAVTEGLFIPPLPEEKSTALFGRGMGSIEKVLALLAKPLQGVDLNCTMPVYWAEDEILSAEGMYSANSRAAKREEGTKGQHSANSSDCHWQKNVYGLTYDDEGLVVSLWLHGETGRYLCAMPEADAVEELTALLTFIYGQQVDVEGVVRSNWGQNPFTRGSYSFPAVGCKKGTVEQLASPLPSTENPRMCFAGEATHPRFFSTMHAAIEAGEREAERVATFLRLPIKEEGDT